VRWNGDGEVLQVQQCRSERAFQVDEELCKRREERIDGNDATQVPYF
jgi:hypothetical protein